MLLLLFPERIAMRNVGDCSCPYKCLKDRCTPVATPVPCSVSLFYISLCTGNPRQVSEDLLVLVKSASVGQVVAEYTCTKGVYGVHAEPICTPRVGCVIILVLDREVPAHGMINVNVRWVDIQADGT